MNAIMKVSSFVFGALMLLSLPAIAQAPPAANEAPPPPPPPPAATATGGMGSQGQIVLSADLPLLSAAPVLGVIRTSTSFMGQSASSTAVGIAASGDYFVAPNVSVGALLGYMDQNDITRIAVFARGGYSLMLTDVLSIWPRLGLGYVHASTTVAGIDASSSAFWLTVDVPVLWHPAPHFFIGAGPMLQTQITSSASQGGTSGDAPKETDLGIMTLIGGYFGG